ncbi:MAG: aminotransferase class I/II-fold pyridoxal phosphate-dependent enzyme [bacterium]|nr:aminotransferase class I/II-fold pyridoxal phosphate-dependent enzyme [bacterium]
MLRFSKNSLRIPYALAVHGIPERKRVLRVLDEHRTSMGRETAEFEQRVARAFGKRYGVMVNSGSSANLLALELLNLPPGSEVITPLLTFSTTVAPLIQKGLVPVFVDVEPGSYVINVAQIEKLITRKTRALMIPLLLGNVPDIARLRRIAKRHRLFLIEDSCDTLGARWSGKPTGAYSDITTTSFYGSHIITAGGGGGMIMVNRKEDRDRLLVLRGWGRNSSLFAESENLKKRFSVKLGRIPYDAKFVFGEIGYNFLPIEMSAAFGNAQMERLPQFRKTREQNFKRLYKFFERYEQFFTLPRLDRRARTQWLAFPLTIKKSAPFSRLEICTHLEEHNVQTRPLFTGNVLKQPGFRAITHRIIRGGCPVTDEIMERGFVVGCHHGLTPRHLERLEKLFTAFLSRHDTDR